MNENGIEAKDFINCLTSKGVRFFTGVPDSLLKNLIACIDVCIDTPNHIIASNEGAAIALGIGHFLATGLTPLVYMQNSGIGNSVNPVTSLSNSKIWGCPALLIIGWRGELDEDGSQIVDEPQHCFQGSITLSMLEVLEIPYEVIGGADDYDGVISKALARANDLCQPVAIVVRKGTFKSNKFARDRFDEYGSERPTRESCVQVVLNNLPAGTPVVCTTGMISREVFEHRKSLNLRHDEDLLCVGGMGHAISIASGVACANLGSKTVCLDGDGSMLMHLGSVTTAATLPNLIHIVLNNGVHDSVGAQSTCAPAASLSAIATAAGYQNVIQVSQLDDLPELIKDAQSIKGSQFFEVMCRSGHREDLGRPTITSQVNKLNFMRAMMELNSK
jgi:phosphonopyruvate decarboxylase